MLQQWEIQCCRAMEKTEASANNRQMAESRLLSTKRNLENKEFVEKEYQKTVETYVEKGYLRKVPETEAPPPEIWYLPHFPIVKMSKSTTKVRIVFDCSARCNGISLNDIIHAGPRLHRELFDVLIRFRRNPGAIVCDIQSAYEMKNNCCLFEGF